MMLRRLWQVLTFEGLSGLKRKVRMVLNNAQLVPFTSGEDIDASGSPSTFTRKDLGTSPPLPGALLLGHPYGVLGMGEHIRLSAAACSAAHIPFAIRNIFGEHGTHLADVHQDFLYKQKISRGECYKANIFHINADEMHNAQRHLGEDIFTGRYNVGYWAWELSQFPDAWCSALQQVDEVWAPSRFIEQAIAHKTSSPVIRMPLAVDFPYPSGIDRRYFGLPEQCFLFLFFFDFTSFVHRKNPQGAIRAFLQAFPDLHDTRVGIVIKMNGMDLRPKEYHSFMQSLNRQDPRIVVMDSVLTDRETKGLVNVCDCFLSLHRSEGFGRGLAEAMYLGKPVIATAYSGNLDFMNEQNACLVDYALIPVQEHEYPFATGQKWADPDLDHAVWFMRRLVEDRQYGSLIGQQASAFIKAFHSPNMVGTRYRKRLSLLQML